LLAADSASFSPTILCALRIYLLTYLLTYLLSYMGMLSVCPSVTTWYGFKARWDRDSGSSPYDRLESLVSNAIIFVPLGEEIPLERGHQRGVPPPLEIVLLPQLPHLA